MKTERNTKGKLVFLCFSEVRPIFDLQSKVKKNPQILTILRIFYLLFHRYIGKRFLQQRPERIYRLDERTLRRGMGRFHRGAEADDIEPGVLAENDRALQTRVIYLYDALTSEEFLVFLQQQVQEF